MSKYKKIMLNQGIIEKDLLEDIHKVDKRVDKSLLSKFVNDVCLPNPNVLDCLCKTLNCDVLEVYDAREIDLLRDAKNARKHSNHNGKSHGENVYNLTVELDRDIASRVFNKTALKKLGFKNRTHCIKSFVFALDKKLQKIYQKEKAVKRDDTHLNGSPNAN